MRPQSRRRSSALGTLIGIVLLPACSPRYAPPTTYSPFHCPSLDASYEGREAAEDPGVSSGHDRRARAPVDPALGWKDEIDRATSLCRSKAIESPAMYGDCSWVPRVFEDYFALEETPLTHVPGIGAYRAIFTSTFGSTAMVRVVRVDGQNILVAKVASLRGSGQPLHWSTTARLSEAEWNQVVQAARRLPPGAPERFSARPSSPAPPKHPYADCLIFDGALVSVERIEAGDFRIAAGRYESTRPKACASDPCCTPGDYELSQFFDYLETLVPCVKAQRAARR